jgi:protein-disulfide isomerase
MATHVTGVLLAILVIWRAPGSLKSEIGNPKSERNPRYKIRFSDFRFRIWSLAGVGLAGILAASQAAFTPPAAFRGGDSREQLPALDARAVPLVGSPEASYVVALLFDYECPHCQKLYFMLDEAVRRYNGKLAFALCPAPLNTHCNPYVSRDVDEFKDSCELARIGLAVWKADREAFSTFDRWMFFFESGDRWQPRSPAAARAKAVELVGEAKFDSAMADSWGARYLQTSTRIYGATVRNGKGGVPRLVFGSRWVIPQPNDADELLSILQNSLGLPKPLTAKNESWTTLNA